MCAQTTKGAPIHILGWYRGREIVGGIEVPKLLSLLAYHDSDATVTGLDAVPAANRPPVNVVRIAFQTMVGIGSLLALLSIVYLYLRVRQRRLPRPIWFYRSPLGAGRGPRGVAIRDHAADGTAVVWEANHVWLIYVLVVCWTAYPVAFGSITSTLAVPLFLAAVGIIFRGTAYALRSPAAGRREQ